MHRRMVNVCLGLWYKLLEGFLFELLRFPVLKQGEIEKPTIVATLMIGTMI